MRKAWLAIGLWALLSPAVPAMAQDQPQDERARLRERILRRVDEYLEEQMRRLRGEVERILDEELARRGQPPEPGQQPQGPRPGYLGIGLDLTEAGEIEITTVQPGSPAAQAGLQAGDIILAAGGQAVGDDVRALIQRVQQTGAGNPLEIRYRRRSEERTATVTLAERPAELEPPREEPREAPPQEPQPQDQRREELRDRIRRFMERDRDRPIPEPERRPRLPGLEGLEDFQFDMPDMEQLRQMLQNPEELLEQLQQQLEQMGIDPDELRRQLEEALNRFRGRQPREEPLAGDQRGFLGVAVNDLSAQTRAAHNLGEGVGVAVLSVVGGSAAEAAGIQANDILVELDGQPIRGREDLVGRLGAKHAGETVRIRLLRGDEEREISATLKARED